MGKDIRAIYGSVVPQKPARAISSSRASAHRIDPEDAEIWKAEEAIRMKHMPTYKPLMREGLPNRLYTKAEVRAPTTLRNTRAIRDIIAARRAAPLDMTSSSQGSFIRGGNTSYAQIGN